MAELDDGPEAEAPDPLGSLGAGIGAAIAAALGRRSAKTDPELDRFLKQQTRLAELQTEHLHEQRELVLSRLRWGRFSDRMRAMLQVMTALVGLAVVSVVAVMAWQAHRDHGVVIEAFSVPPDLAAKGLTGQVVASRLLDRLAVLQAQTVTARPASSFASDWGDDIKVEIPETGVSIGELNRYLRQWLGSQIRISGEVVRTASGLALTARAGLSGGRSYEGAETDADKLIGQAAEGIYAQTQPYRWAVYLRSRGDIPQALATFAWLARSGSKEDRPWAYLGWASALDLSGDRRQAELRAKQAVALKAPGANGYLYIAESSLHHQEAAYQAMVAFARDMDAGRSGLDAPRDVSRLVPLGTAAQIKHDDLASLRYVPRQGFDIEGLAGAWTPTGAVVTALIHMHDVQGARRKLADDPAGGGAAAPRFILESDISEALEDWRAAAKGWEELKGPGAWTVTDLTRAYLALAYAHLGRQAEAEAMIAPTPLDCDDCVDARGQIAAARGDWASADRWFANVAGRTPSIPDAQLHWGQALLAKGDLDRAIQQLEEAHRRGPHWADPLESWGEALMRKGDPKGAIAKFAEADKDAPRWGRNHMRWGEALMLSGRYAEARRQYEAASGMDLSKPDRAALDVLLERTASGPLHG
jgi:tetratricopeptide (TPR) repeat protein